MAISTCYSPQDLLRIKDGMKEELEAIRTNVGTIDGTTGVRSYELEARTFPKRTRGKRGDRRSGGRDSSRTSNALSGSHPRHYASRQHVGSAASLPDEEPGHSSRRGGSSTASGSTAAPQAQASPAAARLAPHERPDRSLMEQRLAIAEGLQAAMPALFKDATLAARATFKYEDEDKVVCMLKAHDARK